MKSKQEFLAYCEQLTKNDVELKQKTKAFQGKSTLTIILTILGCGVLVIGLGLLIVAATTDFNLFVVGGGIAMLIAPVGFLTIFLLLITTAIPELKKINAYKYYENKYKTEIVNFLLEGKTYSFAPDKKIDSKIFSQSQLFGGFNRYSGEDLLTIVEPTNHGDLTVDMCDLTVEYVSRDKDGKTSTQTIFSGIFGVCYLPKPCEFSIGVNCGKFKYKKVQLESIDFNKEFKIYSDDQIHARVVFTPDRMEKIMHLQSKTSNRPYVHLTGNKIYFGISGARLFSAIYEKQTQTITAEDFYYDVAMMEQLFGFVKQILEDIY